MNGRIRIYFICIISFCLYDSSLAQLTAKNTIISHFNPPDGYERTNYKAKSFSYWIGNLTLKPEGSEVLDYRGHTFKDKSDSTVAAVIKWDIYGKRLEQCMDILVRFYAEYLWENNRQDELNLPLPGKQSIKWSDWEKGFRPKFKGIKFELINSEKYNNTKTNFNKYLNLIFAESHTQQFYFAYPEIERHKVQVGDFVVKKGVNGHAIMIMDLAQNSNGELVALIAQGDTPACEFYLLNYKNDNPWFPLNFSESVIPLPIKKKMTWDGLRRFE